MDHFQATRTDIPFPSFSEAVRAASEKASALKGTADYLDVEPYQNFLQDHSFCVDVARGLETSVRQRKEEYDHLMLEVGRNISASPPVREGIQNRLRKLAYNPLAELCAQESIARSVAQLTAAHKSLANILGIKHPIIAFVSQTRMVANAKPRPGNTAACSNRVGFLREIFDEALAGVKEGLVRANSSWQHAFSTPGSGY